MANPKKKWWPGWMTATLATAITVGITGVATLAPAPVFAVHEDPYPFELDGNIAGNGKMDWATEMPFLAAQNEVFVPDAGGNGGKEPSAFKGSNKDIDAINTWEYENSKVTPDKDNITNAYALARIVDVNGAQAGGEHQVIYFGADRFSNNGDAALGFWFFQSAVGPGPNGFFQGTHVARSADGPGDILVQVDFSPNPDATKPPTFEIQIFEWVGSGGSHGSLDELEFVSTQGNIVCIGDSGATQHDDAACATTNSAVDINSPWAYRAKDTKFADNVMPKQSFFEGGIDITELVGEVCFSSYLAETRSSHSETAELKDWALGAFELCSIDLQNKVCVEDDEEPYLSPRYNPDTALYETVHKVNIKNDGAGTLHDIQFRDDSIGTDLQCQIVGVTFAPAGSGTAASPALTLPFQIPNNTAWTEVANSLSKDGVATVELFCKSTVNQKRNTASVRAAASEGGSLTVTDDPYAETADDVADCGVTLNANLQLNKFCATEASETIQVNGNPVVIPNPLWTAQDTIAVTLNPNNGFAPRVCVDVRVANTSSPAQAVKVTSITDVEGFLPDGPDPGSDPDPVLYNMLADFKTANNTNGTACDNTPNNAVIDCDVLAPNEVVAFPRCYDTVAPDNNQTNPGLATYSDEVTVIAAGITAGEVDVSDTASCPLCPLPETE